MWECPTKLLIISTVISRFTHKHLQTNKFKESLRFVLQLPSWRRIAFRTGYCCNAHWGNDSGVRAPKPGMHTQEHSAQSSLMLRRKRSADACLTAVRWTWSLCMWNFRFPYTGTDVMFWIRSCILIATHWLHVYMDNNARLHQAWSLLQYMQ